MAPETSSLIPTLSCPARRQPQAARVFALLGMPVKPGDDARPNGLALLVLVDVLDHFRNVVLVLAELGGILDDLFLLGFGLDRLELLVRVRDDRLLGDRDHLHGLSRGGSCRSRGGRAAPTRPEQRNRIEFLPAFGTQDRILLHVVEARAARCAGALGTPFGFSHLKPRMSGFPQGNRPMPRTPAPVKKKRAQSPGGRERYIGLPQW